MSIAPEQGELLEGLTREMPLQPAAVSLGAPERLLAGVVAIAKRDDAGRGAWRLAAG
ncbi:MAG: hypothetical protein ACYCST_09420 [Acidimicrobiales bacterium]